LLKAVELCCEDDRYFYSNLLLVGLTGGSRSLKRGAERQPIMEVWGLYPQWSPLVRGQEASPPEAERIFLIHIYI